MQANGSGLKVQGKISDSWGSVHELRADLSP